MAFMDDLLRQLTSGVQAMLPQERLDELAQLEAQRQTERLAYDPARLVEGLIQQTPVQQPQVQAEAPQGAEAPTRENGYYIPEFPMDFNAPIITEPQPAGAAYPQEQARANRMNANWGNEGFTFVVDPVTGQTTISNTELTRARAAQRMNAPGQGTAHGIALTTPTKTEAQAPINFRASMQAIQAEQDPVTRAQMFADLQTQAATFKSTLWANSLKAAEQKLGIPELEATLAQNEQLDRSDSKWQQFQSDSPITARIRQQLLRQRAVADDEAKRSLQGNVTLASMDSQIAAATNVFNRMEKQQDLRDTKEAAKQDRKDQFEFQRQYTEQQQDQDMLQQTSPEMLNRMPLIDPSFAGKSPIDLARYINKGVRDAATKEALLAPDEALPELSLIGGNKAAERVLIAKEAERTGKSQEEVARNLKLMQQGMLNDKELEKQLRLIYPQDKAAIDTAKMQLQRATLGGTKADKEAAQALKWQVAQAAVQRGAEANFYGDVSGWGLPDPELGAAVEQAKSTTGSATASAVLSAFIGDRIGAERQARIDAFMQLLDTAAAPRTRSLLAPINVESIKQNLIMDINRQMARGIEGQVMDAVNTMPNPFRAALAPFTLGSQARSFFGGE